MSLIMLVITQPGVHPLNMLYHTVQFDLVEIPQWLPSYHLVALRSCLQFSEGALSSMVRGRP